MIRVLVTGAGGFIGTWLVRKLKQEGYWVRGVDIKYPEWSKSEADQFWPCDLRDAEMATIAARGANWVFHLAANMGGMGHLSTHGSEIIRDNTQINVNMLEASRKARVNKYLLSSSACIYPVNLQKSVDEVILLKETDAYPSLPQAMYGWEKLHAEHLCRAYCDAGWVNAAIVRFFNVYGPEGAWVGGREKAPAALCRKVARAKLLGERNVEVWGSGMQKRSFMYIDDCVEGLLRLMQSDCLGPLNLGRDRGGNCGCVS